jgi:glycerol-3-phosphate dehydrogenase
VPPLSVGDTASHAVYYEAATNDSRLALATVTAAARSGAVVANYLRAMDLDLALGRISRVSLQGRRGEIAVRCRAVVNTTGASVSSPSSRAARLAKGEEATLHASREHPTYGRRSTMRLAKSGP